MATAAATKSSQISELVTKLRAVTVAGDQDAQIAIQTIQNYGPEAETILEQVIAVGGTLPAPLGEYSAPVIIGAVSILHVVQWLEVMATKIKTVV